MSPYKKLGRDAQFYQDIGRSIPKTMSENENQQEIVPVEIDSQDEKEYFKANKELSRTDLTTVVQ